MYIHAISLFDQVLKIDSSYAEAIYCKAETLKKLGRSDEAQQLFDTVKDHSAYKCDFIISPKKVTAKVTEATYSTGLIPTAD
jgi:thioredoxin-like negative regulator of GroEL